MTGTLREMSGVTVPVTTSSEVVARSDGRGERKLLRMVHREQADVHSGTTFAGGGASAAGSPCALLQPPRRQQ